MESINTKKKPLITVITATYNGEKTISQTIYSVLNQTYQNIELIIVDDGSTDNTVSIINKVDDKRIICLTTPNSGGPAIPRNKALKIARGEYVAFCDQDDIWFSERLETNMALLSSCPDKNDVGLVYSSVTLIDERGRKIGYNIVPYDYFLPSRAAFQALLKGNNITASSILFPKKIIKEVGLMDENLFGVDDYDYWLRITQKYGTLAISKVLCSWRQSASALSNNKLKQYIETEKIFDKLGDKIKDIRYGHGKNLVRIILASLLQKDFITAKLYLRKIKGYPLSLKTNIIVKISNFSLIAGYMFVRLLKIMGKVSL